MNMNQDLHCFKDAQAVDILRAQVLELIKEPEIDATDAQAARAALIREKFKLEKILKEFH